MIGSAVQRGSFVYIYDEKAHYISSIPAYKGLVGYTGSTVTVTDGHFNYMYDEKGHRVGSISAK